MKVVVTGGAGFIGRHLCAALLERGDEVVCVDNFATSSKAGAASLEASPGFKLVEADVCDGLPGGDIGSFEALYHLASAASPADFRRLALETLRVGSAATEACLDAAAAQGARFVLASTSEVYGEPLEHPQREEYWGNVNPVGPRSMYDEAKRFAEALTTAYISRRGVRGGIVRIFNTYGPGMRSDDGRVVPAFVTQALAGLPLVCFGDGSQTRSLCHVDDLVRGLLAMVDCEATGPINLGNPQEVTIAELAALVIKLSGSASRIEYAALPADDPTRRCPDISRAQRELGFQPSIDLEAGLAAVIARQAAGGDAPG